MLKLLNVVSSKLRRSEPLGARRLILSPLLCSDPAVSTSFCNAALEIVSRLLGRRTQRLREEGGSWLIRLIVAGVSKQKSPRHHVTDCHKVYKSRRQTELVGSSPRLYESPLLVFARPRLPFLILSSISHNAHPRIRPLHAHVSCAATPISDVRPHARLLESDSWTTDDVRRLVK